MTQAPLPTLVPAADFDTIVVEARTRLQALSKTGSKYRDLVQVARIHQELANKLSAMIYGGYPGSPKLACVSGCATCCSIPSGARPNGVGNTFGMSILDMITLVENYASIKSADAAAPDRAIGALIYAGHTSELVPCPHLRPDGRCGIYDVRPASCKIWFSTALPLCIRNRDVGYNVGINPGTDASVNLYTKFQAPFADYVNTIVPELQFDHWDFLVCLADAAWRDRTDALDEFRNEIETGFPRKWKAAPAP